jgi:PhzF family phenazine biosynthesis protein
MDVFTVDAFTRRGRGGNAAAVVLDTDGLDAEAMQAIAAAMGLSETSFVLPSEHADRRVRFFTPNAEVRLCGHATIATWHLLLERGLIEPGGYTMETRAGIQRVTCDPDGVVFMTQNRPEYGDVLPRGPVARSLGLDPGDLVDHMPVQVASTGLHKIFAPVTTLEALRRIRPDLPAIEDLARSVGAIGIYAFTRETLHGATAHCRNFSPVVGISEDAATGTSAAATACLLVHHRQVDPDEARSLVFEQGFCIDLPSEIRVSISVENDRVESVRVGGRASTRGARPAPRGDS